MSEENNPTPSGETGAADTSATSDSQAEGKPEDKKDDQGKGPEVERADQTGDDLKKPDVASDLSKVGEDAATAAQQAGKKLLDDAKAKVDELHGLIDDHIGEGVISHELRMAKNQFKAALRWIEDHIRAL